MSAHELSEHFDFSDYAQGLKEDFDFSAIKNESDAVRCIVRLPNSFRGTAARQFYKHRSLVGNDVAFRVMIAVWEHDHRNVVPAFDSYEDFILALREVAPSTSRTMPVRIYRGTSDPYAILGPLWATDRQTACFFATARGQQTPYVVYCDIPPEAIVAELDRRDENEIIVDVNYLDWDCIFLEGGGEGGNVIQISDIDNHSEMPKELVERWRSASCRK